MKTSRKTESATSQLSDQTVVERVVNGEKELFEILMRRYNQTLFRVIRSYLKSEETVQDVMQETYLKAYHKLRQFNNDASFSTWLIRIGINESLQLLRKRKRNKVLVLEDHKKNLLRESDKMNPEQKAIQKENRQLIEKAVDQLPEKYRVVYVLREFEGMEHLEIADCLQLTESNVKVRFHRAKKMLKETLYVLSSNREGFEFGNEKCDRLVKQVMNRI